MRVLRYWKTVDLDVPRTPLGTFKYEIVKQQELREGIDTTFTLFNAILKLVKEKTDFCYSVTEVDENVIDQRRHP